ncbi:2OG-Fe(II) oxygenase superfamily protein [Hirsutella rhossiliensis]|uniref:2OG-Fe(II) oxygenase superfamily domain-containing protein n=1 Tax=Hirsutella rhossiliensis TaxID=111463 RepID=A0A9P8SCY1_9HYPO|nr:2OG-Fe(II) oxygenase superfamily domain-containing protein [Hirsutella rhossiliensis]KAH0957364.1 2OG-Fe(II) oxygenase superfamily domain-containing protein [Hirsutella rhossiliensis]
MSKKRTLDAFFSSTSKRAKSQADNEGPPPDIAVGSSTHPRYPFPIANLPPSLGGAASSPPARPAKAVDDQPDLDLLCFEPYMPASVARGMFEFLRAELPFYRVEYDIKRGGVQTRIRTPRWTTVFGLDDTASFDEAGCVVDKATGTKAADKRYDRYPPRPIPACLDGLRRSTETATGCSFNFCLVNYYASGSDSISFHSDDERFLGPDPAIASFSLGARRDFLLKHKPPPPSSSGGRPAEAPAAAKPLKFPLASGDMVLMRGRTQSNWLHSIPKRTGKNEEDGGRINITFRRAMVKDGTENYYNYNVGGGPVYRWDKGSRQMTLWKS